MAIELSFDWSHANFKPCNSVREIWSLGILFLGFLAFSTPVKRRRKNTRFLCKKISISWKYLFNCPGFIGGQYTNFFILRQFCKYIYNICRCCYFLLCICTRIYKFKLNAVNETSFCFGFPLTVYCIISGYPIGGHINSFCIFKGSYW